MLLICSWVNSEELVIPAVRHYSPDMHQILRAFQTLEASIKEKQQGFITNFGRFVNREEALAIAKENNQVKHSIGYEPDELYSEMLY